MGQRPPGRLIASRLLAAAATAAALLTVAPGAWAAPPGRPGFTAYTVSVTPNGAGVVAVNPPLMQGHFSVDDNSAAVTVKAVVSWKGPGPAHQKFPVQDVCPGAQCTADTNGNTDIKDFPLSAVDWNGPYHVEATGDAKDPFGDSTVTTGADFHAAVPPPDPAKVAASVNKDRSVTVAWDRITGTPDLQPFYVYRKGPGDKDFHSFARVLQPASGDRVAIPDPDTKAAGGSYTYQVEARRNGVSGDDTSFVASARTTAKAVTVPNPPPGSPPPPTPPGAKGPGAPPPLLRSSPFGGSSVGSSGSGSPATTEEVTPDPGFVRGLPYGNRANPGDNSSDNPSVGLNRKGGNGSGNKGVLIPAAFGAILFVGAFQLRWLMRTIEQAPIPPIA